MPSKQDIVNRATSASSHHSPQDKGGTVVKTQSRPTARKISPKRAKKQKSKKGQGPKQHFDKIETGDQWSQLVKYYIQCLRLENLQQYVIDNKSTICHFFPSEPKQVHDFLTGQIALEFQMSYSGRSTPIARFLNQDRQGQQLCMGYPTLVVKKGQLAPLIVSPVTVNKSQTLFSIQAEEPMPSYAALSVLKLKNEEIEALLEECASAHPQTGQSITAAWENFLVNHLSELLGQAIDKRAWDGRGAVPVDRRALLSAPCLFWVSSQSTKSLIKELECLSTSNFWSYVPSNLKEILTQVPERDYPELSSLETDSNIYVTEINKRQQQAICALDAEKVTVVTGPPGTGKSQMVLNILSHAVLNNQSVLLASHNNKAVDVVMSRLRKEIRFLGAVRTGNQTNRAKAARNMSAALNHISAHNGQSSVTSPREEYAALKQQLDQAETTLHSVRELKALLESHQTEKENLIACLPKRVARDAKAYTPKYRPKEQEHLQTTISTLRATALDLTNQASRLEDYVRELVEKNSLDHPLLDTLAQFENNWGAFGGRFLHPQGFDTLESIQAYIQNWLALLSAIEIQCQVDALHQRHRELSASCLEKQAKLTTELQEQITPVVSSFDKARLLNLYKQSKQLTVQALANKKGKVSLWDSLLTRVGLKHPKQEIIEQFLILQSSLDLRWLTRVSLQKLTLEEVAQAALYLTNFLHVCIFEKQEKEIQDNLVVKKNGLGKATTALPDALQEDLGRLSLPDIDLDPLRARMQELVPYIKKWIEEREQLAARVNSKLDTNVDALQTLEDYRSNQAGDDKRLWTLKTPTKLKAITGHLTKWRNLVFLWETIATIQKLEKELDEYPTEAQAVKKVKTLEAQQYSTGASLMRSHWLERVKALDTATIQQARDYVSAVEQLAEKDDLTSLQYRILKSNEEEYFTAALQVFPTWATTNLSTKKNFPLKPELFDIVVIDEASQCDFPSALPLLYRAKRVIIIGDRNQLRHVATLHPDSDLEACAKFGVAPSAFRYGTHSLFDIAQRSVGNRPGEIMLQEHYRSNRQIIGFSSEEFYSNQIIIRTDFQRRGVPQSFINTGCGSFWVHVDGMAKHPPGGSAFNKAEFEALQHLVPDLLQRLRQYETNDYCFSLGIVTPYRKQADRIKNWVSQKFGRDHKIRVGTAHAFQGDECDVMIFSSVLAPGLSEGSLKWLNRTDNLLNVAITRARLLMIVLGHWDYCHTLPSSSKYRRLADYIGIQLQQTVHQANQLPIFDNEPFNIIGAKTEAAMSEYNRTTLRRLIASCRDFVWWIDPYLNNAIFDLFLDIFQDPQVKIHDVRLLTLHEQVRASDGKQPAIDRTRVKSVQNELSKHGVRFELKFLKKRDIPHDRFLYSHDKAINMPPFGVAYGQHMRVSEYTRSKTDTTFFEEHWEKASPVSGD